VDYHDGKLLIANWDSRTFEIIAKDNTRSKIQQNNKTTKQQNNKTTKQQNNKTTKT